MAHVHGLRCRECGREYDVAPDLHLRVVLRPARGRLRLRRDRRGDQPREDRRRARSSIWRYADLLPVDAQPGGRPRRRLHAARAGRPPRRRARPRRGVDQERHRATRRTRSRTASSSVALSQGARVRLQGRGVRVDRQPRQLGRRARRARRAAQLRVHPRRTSSRARSSRPRSTAATSSRSTATTTTSTACAPSSPASYQWAFVNVNVRPYYAEGSKTLAFETAEQLGWQAPDHVVVPIASGSLLTKIQQGLRRAAQGRAARRGAAGARVGRAGARLLAGRDGVARASPTRSGR